MKGLRGAAGLLLAVQAPLAAQTASRPVVSAAPPSVRSAGLGGATAAIIGYAGSVFTNPAGLATVRIIALEGAFARYDSASNYFTGAAAIRVGRVNVGGGLRYLRFDQGQEYYDNLESSGAVTLRLKGLAWGLGGSYYAVEDSAGNISRVATAASAVTVAFFDIAALAITARNLGEWSLGGETLDLPTRVSVGFSLNLVDTYSNWRLLVAIERNWIDGDGQTYFGVEGGAVLYGVGLVGRAGTGGRPTGEPFGNGTLGGSLVLGRAAIDYAYLDGRDRPPLHMFGLRWTP